MLTRVFLHDPVLSRSRRKPCFEVEHFPTKAVTDVKGGGGWGMMPFISRVHGEQSRSCDTPTAASNVADQLSTSDLILSVQARRFSLSIFFSAIGLV